MVNENDEENMRDMTLGALTAPKLDIKSKGVVLPIPTPGSGVVIKPGILRLLPKFGGETSDDPIRHLEEFSEICHIVGLRIMSCESATHP